MKQIKIAKILKRFTVLTGVVGGIFFFWYLPLFIEEAAIMNNLQWLRWPGTFGIWVIALLCYLALFYFWKICTQIGNENSFCKENAYFMKIIGMLAIIVCGCVVFGNVVLAFFHLLSGAMIIFSFFVIFVGCGIAVICYALSKLIENATIIKEENDLTV